MPIFGKSMTDQWIIRQNTPNTFTIINSLGKEVYKIETKTAATRSYYYLLSSKEELGSIEQDPIENKYKLKIKDLKISNLKISDKEVSLDNSLNLKSKREIRGSRFDFYDKKGVLHFTIDKTKLSMNDKYKIENLKSADHKLAILIAVCIDDFFHKGLKK